MKHLHQLQSILNLYAMLERRHYVSGTDRKEDDASHSLSVAMICWHYHEKLELQQLSEAKIFKYALIHDLVEVYAGDVMTYAGANAIRQKEVDEQKALERLTKEFRESNDLVVRLRKYQQISDAESLFVWTCDKIQAYTQGSLDQWRPYLENSVSKPMFINKLHEQIAKSSPLLKDEFKRLSRVWIASYPDGA